jgi:hypothetical protein
MQGTLQIKTCLLVGENTGLLEGVVSAGEDGWQHEIPCEHQSSRSFQSMFLALGHWL